MNDAPIGIFDSGVGGLTVARAVIDQLPRESVLYVGDTAHTPYGTKSIAEVRRLALGVLDSLVEQDVKMLVIACNTASAAMLRDARERYSVPVIEVIKPAVRSAVAFTRNNRVGVIGTTATIESKAYEDAFAAAPQLKLFPQACPEFVELVEAGITAGPVVLEVAEKYLAPLRDAEVDTLVLGCTHYPFLQGAISYVMGPEVTLVSSATETANDVYRELVRSDALNSGAHAPDYRFEATAEDGAPFMALARRFLGPSVVSVDHLDTGVITALGAQG